MRPSGRVRPPAPLQRRHIRQVASRIDRARRVRIELSEHRVEVVLRRTAGGDELKGLSQRLGGRQADDQDLGDLTTGDDAIAGIASMASVTLEEHEVMLVGLVVVDPAGP